MKAHPIEKWAFRTAIVMGADDEVSEVDAVKGFASRFAADLTLLEGSQHYLHTVEEIGAIRTWIMGKLI